MSDPIPPEMYQLRLRLCAISPLIWRRLLVRSDTPLVALHAVIQAAFGWPEAAAHCFIIHGTTFGSATGPASTEPADPHSVPLATFHLRPNERFTYVYGGVDRWHHEIRLEQVLAHDPRRHYPLCIGGARATPLDGCGGPASFLALRDHFSLRYVAACLLARYPADDQPAWHVERLLLQYWAGVDRFDRRAANRRLAPQIATAPATPAQGREVRP